MNQFIAVAIGGAAGSVLRLLLSTWGNTASAGLPIGTLLANLLGCFAIGILTIMLTDQRIGEAARIGILIGLLGGFTTFSSFAWQTLTLIEGGQWGRGLLYLGISNVGGLLVAWLGMKLGNSLQGAQVSA